MFKFDQVRFFFICVLVFVLCDFEVGRK